MCHEDPKCRRSKYCLVSWKKNPADRPIASSNGQVRHVKSHTIVVAQVNGCLPLHHRMMCSMISWSGLPHLFNCTLLLLLLPTYVISIQDKIAMELLKLQNIQHVAAPFLCSKPGRQPSECGRLTSRPKVGDCVCSESEPRSTAAVKRKPRQGLLPKGVSHGGYVMICRHDS